MRDNISTPGRGETWYEGETPDTANLKGVELEGQVKVFEDINWGDRGIKSYRSARPVVCRLVRNMSGITLLPKRLVQLDPANNYNRVTGYAATLASYAVPVDEFLPATGVPNGDLFWVVVAGPATILTPVAGATFDNGNINKGDIVNAATAAASTGTGTTGVAGRITGVSIGAFTTAAQFQLLRDVAANMVGRALSARTTGETNADLLVDVCTKPGAGW